MLGLMDEYYGAKSDAVVKKMISDGLLPPRHARRPPRRQPAERAQSEAPGQAATMKLLEANDLATPDFTLGRRRPVDEPDDGRLRAVAAALHHRVGGAHQADRRRASTPKYWKLG